jgi:integrase
LTQDQRQEAELLKLETTIQERKQKGVIRSGGLSFGNWEDWAETYIAFRYRDSLLSQKRMLQHWHTVQRYLVERKQIHPRQWHQEDNQRYGEWKAALVRRSGKVYAATGARRDLNALRMLMLEAVRREYIPANKVSLKNVPKGEAKEKPELTDAQIQKIRQSLNDEASPDLAIAFEVALHTGCRLRETQIALDDIDFARKTITWPAPKGGKRKAFTAPILGPDFLRWLKARVQVCRAQGSSKLCVLGAFESRNFGRLCDRIGLPDITFHCLRPTFVTRCYRAGMGEHVVMRLVNHSSALVHAIYKRLKVEDIASLAVPIELPPLLVGSLSTPTRTLNKSAPRKAGARSPSKPKGANRVYPSLRTVPKV